MNRELERVMVSPDAFTSWAARLVARTMISQALRRIVERIERGDAYWRGMP